MSNLRSMDLCDRCRWKHVHGKCSEVGWWSECDKFEDKEEYERAMALEAVDPYLDLLDECILLAPSQFGVCCRPFVLLKEEVERLAVENYRLRNP